MRRVIYICIEADIYTLCGVVVSLKGLSYYPCPQVSAHRLGSRQVIHSIPMRRQPIGSHNKGGVVKVDASLLAKTFSKETVLDSFFACVHGLYLTTCENI